MTPRQLALAFALAIAPSAPGALCAALAAQNPRFEQRALAAALRELDHEPDSGARAIAAVEGVAANDSAAAADALLDAAQQLGQLAAPRRPSVPSGRSGAAAARYGASSSSSSRGARQADSRWRTRWRALITAVGVMPNCAASSSIDASSKMRST